MIEVECWASLEASNSNNNDLVSSNLVRMCA